MIGVDEIQINTGQVQQKRPLLPSPVAHVISTAAMGARISLRMTYLITNSILHTTKLSIKTSFGVGRTVLVNAVSSALALHQLASRSTKEEGRSVDEDTSQALIIPENSSKFLKVLDLYTSNSIYAINAAFSLAELLTLTGFHLYSTTVNFTLEMAEEAVTLFDGLFGETDTSKALAGVIQMFYQEIQGQDDALGLTERFGKVYALGVFTKSVTAYCCLQYLNRKRWRPLIKLDCVFQGRVPKVLGGYDPSAEVKTKDMFTTSTPQPSPPNNLPSILRQRSIEMLDLTHLHSKSFEDLHNANHTQEKMLLRRSRSVSDVGRRRCFSAESPLQKSKSPLCFSVSPMASTFDYVEENTFQIPRYPKTLESHAFSPHHKAKDSSDSDLTADAASLPDITITHEENTENLRPDSDIAVDLIRNGARFVQFAVGAYGTNFLKIMGIEKRRSSRFEIIDEHHNHYSLANHTDIPVEDVISSSYTTLPTLHAPKVLAPVHYVVVDQETKSIVVSLRGTLGLSDIVTDLTASYVNFKYHDIDGFVHSGMYQSALQIASSTITEAVAEVLKQYPTYNLVLTGHSLGGGCAALLTMLWSQPIFLPDGSVKFQTNPSSGLPPRPIHCYVFACPAIVSSDLSKFLSNLITTFIYRNDVIPCLSLGLISDFRNITISFGHEEGMAESVIAKVLGIYKEEERDELWYWALLKTLRADMKADKLYPPGRIFWINAREGDQVIDPSLDKTGTSMLSIWEVDDVEDAFSELCFSTSMFSDHSPHHYEGSLELLMTLEKFNR